MFLDTERVGGTTSSAVVLDSRHTLSFDNNSSTGRIINDRYHKSGEKLPLIPVEESGRTRRRKRKEKSGSSAPMSRRVRAILAGLCAIPAIFIQLLCSLLVMVLSLPSILLLHHNKKSSLADHEDATTQVIITGGSSGIGLAIAQDCIQSGIAKRIILLARNQAKLDEAQALLEETAGSTKTEVRTYSVDVTNADRLEEVALSIHATIGRDEKMRTLLFCCAGLARPGRFDELPIQVMEDLANVNYLGSVATAKAFLPWMVKQDGDDDDTPCSGGTITFTSSAAGQLGVYGYTAYCPTKFALRGFAEALHMELLTEKDVHVQITYPPDTDTPGYRAENDFKPVECQLMSETAGLWEPSAVAERMVREAMAPSPKYSVSFGLEGWMLETLTAGMSPTSSVASTVHQVGLAGLLRFVSLFYLDDFHGIVEMCAGASASSPIYPSYSEGEERKTHKRSGSNLSRKSNGGSSIASATSYQIHGTHTVESLSS
mmetsp:Transcript_37923/g.56363  ORF Transcript_37923/g.56363 Transcript_37923/m.56363 type:complete len:488 (-) Transcript_37923:265-1728(-)